jgi:hypothetical protein
MRIQLYLLLLCCTASSMAQNTGIGTISPLGKLQINNNNSLRPSLLLADSAALSGGSIRWQNISTGKWMQATAAAGTGFSNGNALIIGSDSLTVASFTGAGNVGIRNTSPAEALDINGNINLNGTIKVNGNDGAAGQVLGKNGSGTLQWQTPAASAAADENLATFTATTPGAVQTFTVPAGVTKITVEAWGGGGTGGIGSATFPGATGGAGGGGGGGYVKALFSVVPGSTVNIIVGLGATSSTLAGSSSVSSGSFTITALPGTNAQVLAGSIFSNPTGTFVPGAGGSYSITGGAFAKYQFVKGADGENPAYRVFTIASNTYTDDYIWGRGGNAGNSSNTGGLGGQSTGLGLGYHVALGTVGGVPGGGGGGGRNVVNNGGNGLVVVRW